MKKICKIIIAIVLVLAIMVAGFLYYNKIQEEKMGPVSFESFKRIESEGKVFMENKDIGLKFMVPEGWEVQNAGWSSISVVSQDFEPFKGDMANAPLADVGCWIDITAETEKITREYTNSIATLIKEVKILPKDGVSIVEISGHDSLKTVSSIGGSNQFGESIYIETPNNNTTYTFQLSFLNNNNNCLNNFNKFLDAIYITNK